MPERKRSKGFVVIMVAAMMGMLIPIVGLGVDAGVLYVIKGRLAAACDGAALAAARNLNVGQTIDAQEDSARDRATSFYAGNFPDSFLGAGRNDPTITIPLNAPGSILTVTAQGRANVAPYFMRYVGVNNVTLNATGTASRRDVNIIMVLDRSGSMDDSGSCEPMKDAATNFVNRFVDGRDRIGLVTFATKVRIDFPPARNFKTAPTNIATLIDQIDCDGYTNVAAAYWRGYLEAVALNNPGALNVIVLFTDGIPNGVVGLYPIRTASASETRYGYTGAPGTACDFTNSTCSMPKSTCPSSTTPLTGLVVTDANSHAATGPTYGLFKYEANGSSNQFETINPSNTSTCAFRQYNAMGARQDIKTFPVLGKDIYGNFLWGGTNQHRAFVSSDYAPGTTLPRVDRPTTVTKASSNALDSAAQRARAFANNPNSIDVATYVIGLGTPSTLDETLMIRVANDPRSSIYVANPRLPQTSYIQASDHAAMAEAFAEIGSEVLRLSH